MNNPRIPWQTPQVERLEVSHTLGATQINSDSGLLANNAFCNPDAMCS